MLYIYLKHHATSFPDASKAPTLGLSSMICLMKNKDPSWRFGHSLLTFSACSSRSGAKVIPGGHLQLAD